MKGFIRLIGLLVFISGCATTKTHTTERTNQKIELSTDIDDAYSIAYKTAMEMSWTITNSDPDMHAFSAKTPVSWQRWEDEVNVYIEADKSKSILTVKSKLGHDPNREHIGNYIEAVMKKTKQY